MAKPWTWHCNCGETFTKDHTMPIKDLVVHLEQHGGLIEPSLAWSLDQAARALRAWADAVLTPVADWLAARIVRFLNRP